MARGNPSGVSSQDTSASDCWARANSAVRFYRCGGGWASAGRIPSLLSVAAATADPACCSLPLLLLLLLEEEAAVVEDDDDMMMMMKLVFLWLV